MNNQEIIDSNQKTEQLTATESQKITVLENGNLMTVSDEGSYMGLFENKDCGDVWLTFDITEVIKPQYIRSLADIKRITLLETQQARAETLIYELHEQVYDSPYLDNKVGLYEALKESK
jgi:hypothetical protein